MKSQKGAHHDDSGDRDAAGELIQGLRRQLVKAHAAATVAEHRALVAEADAAQMRRERDAAQAQLKAACQALQGLADSLDTKGLAADVEGIPSLACALVLASNVVRDTLGKLVVPDRGVG